jgi:hypothetical protein
MKQFPRPAHASRPAQASRKYFYFFIGLVSLVLLMNLAGGVSSRSLDAKRSAAEAKEKKLRELEKALFLGGLATSPQTATSKALFSSPRRSSDHRVIAPLAGTPIFLADAEQIINSSGTITGGVIHFWNITLGASDSFAAGTPSSLAAEPVAGPANSDVDFPNDVIFDDVGDLMVANGGVGNPDFGNFACVPAGAVTTGSSNVTVLSNLANRMDDPEEVAFGSDRSVALINQGGGTPYLEAQFVLSPTYIAAPVNRDIANPNSNPPTGVLGVVALPASAANPAGSYVVSLTAGLTSALNYLRIIHPDGTTVDFPQDASAIRSYIAYDPANNQLVAAADNGPHSHMTFWDVATKTKVKDFVLEDDGTHTGTSQAQALGPISCSADGHVAVLVTGQSGFPELIVYDNTANRNKIQNTLDYGATTTGGGATFVYGGTVDANVATNVIWLNNTKLLVQLQSQQSHNPTSANGMYIYDITQTMAQGGFDVNANSEPTPTIKQTGFQHLSNTPLATAIRTGTVNFADGTGNNCSGNGPCFTSINSAIAALTSGGTVNVLGGTFNESVNLNNASVTVNINATTTINDFTISAGTLTGGGGNCGQVTTFTLNLKGNWANNGGTFAPGGGTVVFNGSSAQTIGGTNPTTFNNLTINNTSGGVSLGNNETVNGALTLTSGALGVGSNTLTLNGAASKTSGTLTSNADGTVNYNQSSGGQNIVAGDYGNLTFSNFAKTLPNGGTVKIAGTFTTGAAGGHTVTGSTVEFNGGSAQALPSNFTTYNNLTLNNTAGTSGFAGLTVQGLIEVKAGTFTSSSTYNNVQIDSGATLAGTNATTINVSGTWTNNGTFTANGNTVNFNGGSLQTIGGTNATTFSNLTINNASGVNLGNSETVGNTLTLTSGALGVGTNTLILNGGISFASGSLTSSATGTVNYNQSSGGQNIAPGSYGNLTFSDFTKTLPNSGTVKIAGTFTTGASGGHTVTGSTVEFNGVSAQALPANFTTYNNLTLNNPAGTSGFAGLTVQGLIRVEQGTFTSSSSYNNVQIDSGATLAGTNATTINVSGSWTNNGTFTANGNTVNFNGGSLQTLGGTSATTFNNLTINNASGVNLGNNETVGNTLTLTNGTLGVGTNTLTLNGGSSVASGSISSSATGTVNYNQSSNSQSVLAANYGNLTFSNFSKTLPNGGTVKIASTFTTGATGGHTVTGSTVEFNGGSAQALPSNFTTYNNLTLNNLAGTTGFAGLTVQGLIEVKAGTFTSSSTYNNVQIDSGATLAGVNATTINVSGSWTNNGTFTANGNSVNFNGSSGQTLGGTSVTTFNNLTIGDSSGLTLGNNATVNGVLALTSGDLDASTFTLTQPNSGSSSGTFDVIGNVKRTGFSTAACGSAPCANTLSFGNPNNQITITAGTAPGSILVNMAKSEPATYAAAVQRNYTITPTGGSGITATLRLHYLVSELNGNTPESSLNLRRFNGSNWVAVVATQPVDMTNHWVESNAVTSFSQWTFSTLAPTAAPATIGGHIADGNGNPVEGTVVRLSGDQSRKTITDANGNYHFDNVETNGFYTVTPSRANFNFNPFNRSFSQLGNNTDAVFTAASTGDNANPLDTAEYFVRQQYVDVLGREPDEAGFNYWSDQILACQGEAGCVSSERTSVAAAFFIEDEFKQAGSYIYDVYQGALGRQPGFAEYATDRQQVVGGAGLDAEKTAFAQSFVERPEFMQKYQTNLTAESLVDALIQNVGQVSGLDLTSQRDNLVSAYNGGANLNQSRGFVVRAMADSSTLSQANYNSAFVLTEYFGYLRRDPDQAGYNFWLNALNTAPGSYRGMVCSFVTSAEYQKRFSGVVSRSNGECGQ